MIDFQFVNTELLSLKQSASWLQNVVATENKKLGEIVFIFFLVAYLLEKNIAFLNHDTLTDVITFDYCTEKKISGDIFISVDRIQENAKILSKYFIKKFNKPILNIHPSLLPKYKGLNTHFRAINNKEKFAGCSVHYVNSKLDSGKIILQRKIKILKNDSEKSLSKRLLKIENQIYPRAVRKFVIANL